MTHTLLFLSDTAVRAEFDCTAEEGGAVSVVGRFNPPAGEGLWADGVWPDAESAADALESAVRVHFGRGPTDATRLTRIVLWREPTTVGEVLLTRYGVPLMWKDSGQ